MLPPAGTAITPSTRGGRRSEACSRSKPA